MSDPPDPDGSLERLRSITADRGPEAALRELDALLAAEPARVASLDLQALRLELLLDRGSYAQALEAARPLHAAQPDSAELTSLLASALELSGLYPEALEVLESHGAAQLVHRIPGLRHLAHRALAARRGLAESAVASRALASVCPSESSEGHGVPFGSEASPETPDSGNPATAPEGALPAHDEGPECPFEPDESPSEPGGLTGAEPRAAAATGTLRAAPELVRALLQLFEGHPRAFARQIQAGRDGRCGYVPVRRPITPADLTHHLAGRTTLGVYLLDPAGSSRLACWDLDLAMRAVRQAATEPVLRARLRELIRAEARRFLALATARSLPVAVESSGQKGFHSTAPLQLPTRLRSVGLYGRIQICTEAGRCQAGWTSTLPVVGPVRGSVSCVTGGTTGTGPTCLPWSRLRLAWFRCMRGPRALAGFRPRSVGRRRRRRPRAVKVVSRTARSPAPGSRRVKASSAATEAGPNDRR
ncbi:MAG: hypothetical protein HY814_11045 [Candidatus Riflebacteria bacterium]|nr:hypothetical protein [Candidatus Riflebacteria bacterium]